MQTNMTTKEKIAYFQDKLYNDEYLAALNQQIAQLRKGGQLEDKIDALCEVRKVHIHKRFEELERLRIDLFCSN